MKLLFMYHCGNGWIETLAIHPKRAYVYWLVGALEEHTEIEDATKYLTVPIGTNPFN